MAVGRAARLYGVPKTTLERYVNGTEYYRRAVYKLVDGGTTLLQELEADLVNFLVEMDKRFHGLRSRDLSGCPCS